MQGPARKPRMILIPILYRMSIFVGQFFNLYATYGIIYIHDCRLICRCIYHFRSQEWSTIRLHSSERNQSTKFVTNDFREALSAIRGYFYRKEKKSIFNSIHPSLCCFYPIRFSHAVREHLFLYKMFSK